MSKQDEIEKLLGECEQLVFLDPGRTGKTKALVDRVIAVCQELREGLKHLELRLSGRVSFNPDLKLHTLPIEKNHLMAVQGFLERANAIAKGEK